MGRPRAFLEIERNEPGYRLEADRLRDYRAVERQLSQNETQRQASRCMDCGTPFCHAYGCPVSNIIPEFNECVYRGNWQQALDLLISENNFPEFTGRVCPAPCEAACVAGLCVDPVTIRQIELAIIEKGFENDYMDARTPGFRHPQRAAVIGSGPAGLAAADTLNQAGYRVTVYDDSRHPGGILRYGIPDFKLEKWVVERRIEMMKAQGVSFEMGVTAGEDVSYRFLKKRYEAICLACGAREPRDLSVPGRDLKGIYFAMDYLMQQNQRVSGERIDPALEVNAKDKTVVVIGGGDTGSDCLGTALRQGAKKVYQFEILPEPPAQRAGYTPWPMWPAMLRETHAQKEGGEVRWSVMTKEFVGKSGVLEGLRCTELAWELNGKGAPIRFAERRGSEFEVKADVVLLAMGFTGPVRNGFVKTLQIRLDQKGLVKTDGHRMTSVRGIFAAGDMVQGQSLVVRAIADGRKAAKGIIAYLGREKNETYTEKTDR